MKKFAFFMVMLLVATVSANAQKKISTEAALDSFQVLVTEMKQYEKVDLNNELVSKWKTRYDRIATYYKESDEHGSEANLEKYYSLQAQYRKVLAKNTMNNIEEGADSLGQKATRAFNKGKSAVKGFINGLKK